MAVIALDWDNTLMVGDKWLPGAQEALKRLREEGHKIIIHSCNNPEWIRKCLENAGIPVDDIWDGEGKPLADLYVDDRGYSFIDWDRGLTEVLNHPHVWGKDNRKW